MNRLN